MQLMRILRIAVGAFVAALTAGIVRTVLRRRRTTEQPQALRRTATTDRRAVFTTDDLSGLPEPVQDYFANVLEEGQQYIKTVRLEQEGTLRVGDTDASWKQFTATQYITTDPPGFFWDASMRLWPLITFQIRDFYRDGKGSARVSLFGLIPVDGDETNPELDEGELLRYLAEAVWYPTALLPSEGVEWEAVDKRSATATLEYGGASATLMFHFSEDDEVSKVYAEQRPRRVDDGYEPTPWTGRWQEYKTQNGMRIPTAGEVIWHLPDGDMEAWRGKVTDISYNDEA